MTWLFRVTSSAPRTSYARNTAGWITEAPSRTETVAKPCATTPTYPADLVTDARFYYDGATTFGTAPTKDNVTKTEQAATYSGGPV